jgi:phosphoglycerate kinase
MKTLDNYSLDNKNILLRVDLNVPFFNGKITNDSRIKIIKKTINKLQQHKNKIFIISHFGRPKGEKNKFYSLEFLCPVLENEFNLNKVVFIKNFNNRDIEKEIINMSPGDICLLENTRFYPGEENNDISFIRNIIKNFDAYVNDAFSASHRNHASIVGIPKLLPSVAGYSLIDEIKNIELFINNFKKPKLAIIGGSKISTKIDLLNNLVKSSDCVAIGGAMANTFLYASKINIGNSLCEKDLSDLALSIMKKAKKYNCKIILPVDVVCADSLSDNVNVRNCSINNIYPNQMILDIGNKTTKIISRHIIKSKMVLWNGPLGAFEYKPFEVSSLEIANVIKKNAKLLNIKTIAGGGDTISAIKMANAEEGFTYISNAGGAFLEWLEGRESPGVIALKENTIT